MPKSCSEILMIGKLPYCHGSPGQASSTRSETENTMWENRPMLRFSEDVITRWSEEEVRDKGSFIKDGK